MMPVTFSNHISRHFDYFVTYSCTNAIAANSHANIGANHINIRIATSGVTLNTGIDLRRKWTETWRDLSEK